MSDVDAFLARWSASGGSEQANAQLFLAELCDVLGVPRPDPAKPENEQNIYSFERKIVVPTLGGGTVIKRLDLYRKGCFVLECKQGQEEGASAPLSLPWVTRSRSVSRRSRQWEDTMTRARRQAENYVHCLPSREGRPPFIIVCDVGYCFDIYAEFTCSGGLYLPYPDTRRYRIGLAELANTDVRRLLQTIWNDPLSLDLSRHAAQVTEKVAGHLAQLAVRLEEEAEPDRVSAFLMRCIFTMFAEDVGLIPHSSFTNMLENALYDPEPLPTYLADVWHAMNTGSTSSYLRKRLKWFNGNIFSNSEILPLDNMDISILLEAAKADWTAVEPAIFGTLLERALDPHERHKLGALYTPRAYVERLVVPTIIQPLRVDWENVQAVAALLADEGDIAAARKTVEDFHKQLCRVRVLDPACGSGNFLYVTLEHLKRLESEVMAEAARYGGTALDAAILPDNQLLNIASADAFHLGVLSSRFHVWWALAVEAGPGKLPFIEHHGIACRFAAALYQTNRAHVLDQIFVLG